MIKNYRIVGVPPNNEARISLPDQENLLTHDAFG
jgi:hypothetical protein